MIEISLYNHMKSSHLLTDNLTTYDNQPAIFNQEAPPDIHSLWASGAQYPRVVFSEDMQGDPERAMGGTLAVDVMCKDGQMTPEEFEPILRAVIDGYFFSNGTFTVAAQWQNSSYFTEPTDEVMGCTLTFQLLGFPVLTTDNPDVVARLNAWSAERDNIHVINHDVLPSEAWKPTTDSAIYWRVYQDKSCSFIPDTFQTIWRTAMVKCHVFAQDIQTASNIARNLAFSLYRDRRLIKQGETPIMVNTSNTIESGADPLKTGQLSIEATYGVIIYRENETTFENISYKNKEG